MQLGKGAAREIGYELDDGLRECLHPLVQDERDWTPLDAKDFIIHEERQSGLEFLFGAAGGQTELA